MEDTTYAVVGGGIAGASIAYHLGRRTDEPVALFERNTPGSETTYKSYALFGWYGDETQYRMKQYAMGLYNEFMADPRANAWYEHVGRLVVATTDAGLDELTGEAEDEESGYVGKLASGGGRAPIEYLDGDEIADRVYAPHLNTDEIAGAVYRPKVGYVSRPHELAHEFATRAEEEGVTIRSNTRVTDVEVDDGAVTGVVLDDEERVRADEVICAAGPWNPKVAAMAGVDLPVRHTLAPVLKFKPRSALAHTFPSMRHVESGCSWRGNVDDDTVLANNYPGGYETATEYDPDTTGEHVPEDVRLEEIERTRQLVPCLDDAEIVDEWVGIRSMTPDGNPIVGWTDLEGFSIAAFNSSGIQLAPSTGDVIARQLVDGEPTELYEELSVSRFDGYTDVHGGDAA